MKALLALVVIAACTTPSMAKPRCAKQPTTAPTPNGVKQLQFAAADKVPITADLYAPHPATAPFVILFHQAGYSRGEYRTVAPRLNALGWNALAIDARSGRATEGVGNATAFAACKLGKGGNYLDAIADLEAAVTYAHEHLAKGKLVIWGSSYSAGLVLAIGAKLRVDGILAFSPGEYFAKLGKSKTWVADGARKLKVPTFITSARDEASNWAPIAKAITAVKPMTFVPKTAGRHGSSALWPTQSDADAYWKATTAFLRQFER